MGVYFVVSGTCTFDFSKVDATNEEYERYQLTNKKRKEREFERSQLALKEQAKKHEFFQRFIQWREQKIG